jgi:hypothetical protein
MKIIEICTEQKKVYLEAMEGFILESKFENIPNNYEDYLAPANKVLELTYWLGFYAER